MAKTNGMDIAFGPVPSRRLGRSLGINHIPPKICSYACVYCQLGRTLKMQLRRQIYFQPQELYRSVSQKLYQTLKQNEVVDYLAFVPDGEPILDANLGIHIELLKSLSIPIAVISNGSLINDSSVCKDLYKADWISLKVDAVNERLWRAIDRPHGRLNLHPLLEGMLLFRKQFNGTLVTETMLLKGMNDSIESFHQLGQFLSHLQPEVAYLSIPTRPPADKSVQPAAPESINIGYQILKNYVDAVELLVTCEGNNFSSAGDIRRDILGITAVHPMHLDAIKKLLSKKKADWTLVEKMLKNGELVRTSYEGHTFFIRNY